MDCALCKDVFGPIVVDGTRHLQTFKGYTVDFRLQEFRKVPVHLPPAFIDFASPKGKRLLEHMHAAAVRYDKQFVKSA